MCIVLTMHILYAIMNVLIKKGVFVMANSTTNISIRMDNELKKQAEQLFSELGMNMTTAFNIFLRQSVRQGKIPFEISLDVPNAETIAAMKEAERISRDPNVKGFASVDELFKELNA